MKKIDIHPPHGHSRPKGELYAMNEQCDERKKAMPLEPRAHSTSYNCTSRTINYLISRRRNPTASKIYLLLLLHTPVICHIFRHLLFCWLEILFRDLSFSHVFLSWQHSLLMRFSCLPVSIEPIVDAPHFWRAVCKPLHRSINFSSSWNVSAHRYCILLLVC